MVRENTNCTIVVKKKNLSGKFPRFSEMDIFEKKKMSFFKIVCPSSTKKSSKP